jgi:hypothetical protein
VYNGKRACAKLQPREKRGKKTDAANGILTADDMQKHNLVEP